eukprot:gene828-832_t
MIPTTPVTVKDGIANPAPLGLCAFGMTTVLLNLHNAGFYELNSMILATGIFYGGLAQVIAGIIESKKNNTFGLTAFTSYGFFWLSLVGLIVLPKLGWGAAPSESAMAAYLTMWGIFTLCLFFDHATGNKTIGLIAGYEGIFCGGSAIYAGVATLSTNMKDFKKYYRIPATAEEIYIALTNPFTMELWTGEKAEMSTEPGKTIVQQWYFDGQPEESIVTIKLHADKTATSVELKHTNIPDADYADITEGWDNSYFGALNEFFEAE